MDSVITKLDNTRGLSKPQRTVICINCTFACQFSCTNIFSFHFLRSVNFYESIDTTPTPTRPPSAHFLPLPNLFRHHTFFLHDARHS